VILNFTGITLATQSFVHALISDALRTSGEAALEKLKYHGCSANVRGIIETVVQYSSKLLTKTTLLQQRKKRLAFCRLDRGLVSDTVRQALALDALQSKCRPFPIGNETVCVAESVFVENSGCKCCSRRQNV